MTDPSPLELEFHQDMLEIYRRAKVEIGYNATRFHQMITNEGGRKTAEKLLATADPSDGFTVLWENHRLDLAMENLILKPKYESLFSEAEREIAKQRLISYGYHMG